MNTNQLIQELSRELKPVSPRLFAQRFAMAAGLSLTYFAALLFLFHHRPDLSLALHSASFLALQAISISAAMLSLALFVRIEIPGSRPSLAQICSYLSLLAAEIFLLLYRFLNPPPDSFPTPAPLHAFHCASTVAVASALLAATLLGMARTQAPPRPLASGALAVAASVAVASVAVDFSCPNENPLHLLFFHLLAPGLAALALFLPLARKFLRW